MKALNWLQERIRQHEKQLTSILVVGGFFLIYISTQKHVNLIANGESMVLSTHARTVGSLFSEMGINVAPGDETFPEPARKLDDEMVVIFNSSRKVVLDEDGELIRTRSTESLPENILAQTGFRIYPGDSIKHYGDPFIDLTLPPENDGLRIRIDRRHVIQLEIEGISAQISSSAATLGEALWEAGIEIYEGDILEPGPDTPLVQALRVSLDRSKSYSIVADDHTFARRGSGETVAEILATAGFDVAGLDYTVPALEEPAPPDRIIRVVRVVEEFLVELEPVEFATTYQPADQLELDSLEVLEPGTFGVRSNSVRIRYEDGEEIERSVEAAHIAVEPKNRVIGYGTRILVRTLDTPQGTIEYWRSIPIYATSYSPCNLGVSWCGTLTASGKEVKRGITGVIRSWYNSMRGWGVFVPGYGPGTIEDIGAGIAGRDWIDLGFTDEDFEPWHQWTTLYFLTPVPPLNSIPWILP